MAQLKVKALVPHDWWLEFNLRDSQWKVRATSQSCPLAVGASVITCTRVCARTHTYTNADFHKREFPLKHFYYVSPVLVCMIPNVLCGNIHSHVFSAVNFPCPRFPVSSYWGSEMVFSMIFIMINLPRIVEYRIFLVPWSFYIKIWSIHVKTHKNYAHCTSPSFHAHRVRSQIIPLHTVCLLMSFVKIVLHISICLLNHKLISFWKIGSPCLA